MKNLTYYKKKNIYLYLKGIYGINTKTSFTICNKLGFNPYSKTENLLSSEMANLNAYLTKNFTIKHHLKQEVKSNIRDLIFLKNYRGRRHSLGLPVRGQRTKTNAKTQKKLSTRYKKPVVKKAKTKLKKKK